MTENLSDYCSTLARNAKLASLRMTTVSGKQKNQMLRNAAKLINERCDFLLRENRKDIDAAPSYGLTDAEIDRLLLNPKRLGEIVTALDEIIQFPDPIGQVISSNVRPNGIDVQKVRVPLGVVFFIYESRPNVTSDAAAICVKSGNAVILRGGKEALHSNIAFADILEEAAGNAGLPDGVVQLVRTTDRDAVSEFLKMPQYINVTIPRGGESLIRRVTNEAAMPVIKHFAGNCHVYIDKAAAPKIAERVLINSKCQRMGVCNAAESLVVHSAVADTLLPRLAAALRERNIELRGDTAACKLVAEMKPATAEDFRTEFHGPIMSVKIVDSLDEAIEHINANSDSHTEAIVTTDYNAAREFAARIDSSA
ncbi:MAG: glutamate-5-semialdehyde dehydrogenase, partial [Planctomycetaceae bacterium]|nr:glutamate-5-semialdehyde dehydrogenase [Planctomycetaceae bacterium]